MAQDMMAEVVIPNLDPNQDSTTHRWYFHTDLVSIDRTTEDTNIQNFYNAVASGATASVSGYYSKAIDRTSGATETRWYDITGHLSGTPHGPPTAITFWQFGATGTDAHTAQLAFVADYHADLTGVSEFSGSTRPRSRRRGRHFHGPIASTAYSPVTTSPFDVKLSSAAQTDIPKAYAAFLSAVASGDEWCVWSRKDAALYPVIGGWVDDTFHTQRRRQDPAGVRQLWP